MRFVLLLSVLASAAPALAQQSDAPAAQDDNKKICRQVDVTGSYLPKRECHTKAEWKKIRQTNQENASRALEHRNMKDNTGM